MEEKRKYLTEEELKRLLKVVTSPRDGAIFTVCYWRGLEIVRDRAPSTERLARASLADST